MLHSSIMCAYTEYMKLDFASLFALLFPPSEDETRVAACTPNSFALKYEPRMQRGIVSLSSFRDADVRAALHLNKFHDHHKAQELLGTLLVAYLSSYPRTAVLIPIPLARARERSRGYNQVLRVIEHAQAGMNGITLAHKALIRTRNTRPQTSLQKGQRQANLKDAFELGTEAAVVRGAHVVLIDDVYTTGATLRAAKSALEKGAPASVTCIALAH